MTGYEYADDNPISGADPTGQNTVGVGCPDRDCHPGLGINPHAKPG